MKDCLKYPSDSRNRFPEIIIKKSAEVDFLAADIVEKQIKEKPDSVLTLPTGATPLGMYDRLVEQFKNGKIDFRKVTIFNLDEYWPIKHSHPSSYHYYMENNFIDQINLDPDNWHIPNGEAADPGDEAIKYGAELLGTHVDLAIVGIGPGTTCHIGFNEKGSSLKSVTRCVPLDAQTRTANSKHFKDPSEIPAGAITQGISDILKTDKIILIAKGKSKSWGINRSLKGEINSEAPASFLRLHKNVVFLLDREAASDL